METIIDLGDGIPFCRGNIMKYLQRYGRKDGYNRKDIMKALHYCLIMLHVHDQEHPPEKMNQVTSSPVIGSGSYHIPAGDTYSTSGIGIRGQ